MVTGGRKRIHFRVMWKGKNAKFKKRVPAGKYVIPDFDETAEKKSRFWRKKEEKS